MIIFMCCAFLALAAAFVVRQRAKRARKQAFKKLVDEIIEENYELLKRLDD